MSDQPIGAEDAVSAKRRKLSEQDRNVAAIEAVVVEAEGSAKALADWLSVENLLAFGQTCKYLQRVAGDIFNEICPTAHVYCKEDGIYFGNIQINGFCDYIQNISFCKNDLSCFRFVQSNTFASLKRIQITGINLTDEKIACIKPILNKAETIEVVRCSLNGDFYDKFLLFCTEMKRLRLESYSKKHRNTPPLLIGADNTWLHREYPTLEDFELKSNHLNRGDLKTFFRLNPNVRKFSSSAKILYDNLSYFNFKLDVLAVEHASDDYKLNMTFLNANETTDLYKKLHLSYASDSTKPWHFDKMSKISKLESLHVRHVDWGHSIPMTNLKELHIGCEIFLLGGGRHLEFVDNIEETVVKSFVNLENVYLSCAKLEDILAFVCGSPKLKTLILPFIDQVQYNGFLPLVTWNNEREKLAFAQKLTIFVNEEIYLRTKRIIHRTDYSSIQLKRNYSFF